MTKKENSDLSTEVKKPEKKVDNRDKETKLRRRRAIKSRGPLYIPLDKLDPNFHYRIFNHSDDRSRIAYAQDLGYEKVTEAELSIGEDDGLNSPSKLGSLVSKPVGSGMTGILMKIPLDLYNEGRKDIETKNDDIDRQLTKKKPGQSRAELQTTIET